MRESLMWKTTALLAVGILAGMLIERTMTPSRADGTSNSNQDMIAVTGEYGNGTSVLYLVDTKTRNLAVYKSMNGNDVQLVAARRIEYDLKIEEFHDKTNAGCRVRELETNYRAYMSRAKGADGFVPVPESRPAGAPGAGSEKK